MLSPFFEDVKTKYNQLAEKREAIRVDGKYLSNGLKPIEFIEGDIQNNLIKWALDKSRRLFYMTKEYWHVYDFRGKYIQIASFDRSRPTVLKTWMNYHSSSCGKDFLNKNMVKRVKDCGQIKESL